ncbi:hypothetical protein LSHI6S_00352 [Leifsonia shinshuensis]
MGSAFGGHKDPVFKTPEPEVTLARIAELSAASDDLPVRRQHVVSRVLLKRFAEPLQGTPKVRAFDLQFGKSKLRSYSSVGYVENFIAFRSAEAERLWARTENLLTDALNAVDRQTLFSEPELVEVIKQAVVMHYLRAEATKLIHQSVWSRVRAQTHAELLADPARLRQFATRRFGTDWEQTRSLTDVADELLAPMTTLQHSDALFQASIENRFDRAQEWVAHQSLEICTSDGPEFVLGDAPAAAYNARRLWPRPALLDASAVVLPLGRTVLASLGPKNQRGSVDRATVNEVNEAQIRQATRRVFAHPKSSVDGFVWSARERRGDPRPRIVSPVKNAAGQVLPASLARAAHSDSLAERCHVER